jgi:hypothetical protein
MRRTGREGQASWALALAIETTNVAASSTQRMQPSYIHVHSTRLASRAEALGGRVLAADGRIGSGDSLALDATEARHMAECHAGVREDGVGKVSLPGAIEAACASIPWLPKEERWVR